LEIKTRIAGSDSNDVALTLNNIGLVYKEKRDYQKALEYFEKSLKIFNAINGEGCANSTAVSKNINDINELLILTAY
jgi:tetratricopeptide (TPR) repeat protein